MLKQVSAILAVAVLGCASSALRAQQVPQGEGFLDAVADCRGQEDRSARLSCYDKVADQLDTARKKNEITVLSRGQVEEQRRAVFGLSVDDGRLFQKSARSLPPIESLDSVVKAVALAGRGLYRVTFEDGSVWRTTDVARWEPEVGDKVHVRRGALGSYLASFDGARSLRIERLR